MYIYTVIYNTIHKLKTHWHQQFLPFVTLYGRGNSCGVSGALSLVRCLWWKAAPFPIQMTQSRPLLQFTIHTPDTGFLISLESTSGSFFSAHIFCFVAFICALFAYYSCWMMKCSISKIKQSGVTSESPVYCQDSAASLVSSADYSNSGQAVREGSSWTSALRQKNHRGPLINWSESICNTGIWPLEGSIDLEIARDWDEGKTAMKKKKKKEPHGNGRSASQMTNTNHAASFEGANVTWNVVVFTRVSGEGNFLLQASLSCSYKGQLLHTVRCYLTLWMVVSVKLFISLLRRSWLKQVNPRK